MKGTHLDYVDSKFKESIFKSKEYGHIIFAVNVDTLIVFFYFFSGLASADKISDIAPVAKSVTKCEEMLTFIVPRT